MTLATAFSSPLKLLLDDGAGAAAGERGDEGEGSRRMTMRMGRARG